MLCLATRICGALFGLVCASAEREAIWILPFASGGFIYIALVSLIPDMYSQETPGFSAWRDVLHVAGGMMLVSLTQVVENHYEGGQ
jgi:zinc transporter 13